MKFSNELKKHLPAFIKFYKDIDGNEAGGTLHIVLADGNVDLLWSMFNDCEEKKDSFGLFLCHILSMYSEEELLKLFESNWKKPQ